MLITFYLPQFHPIPENDAWWGKGFTDWTNVARARPLFHGHHQPHIPADLGFYDLRLAEVRLAQARYAKQAGIGAFCYYHYWFNGRLVLDRPLNDVLASGEPDFPFCICWANENWTRRWDGNDEEVLLAQNYEKYDPAEHIAWLDRAFADRRYIRVDGRPLFLVYRADEIPNLASVIAMWRQRARNLGYSDLYVCSVKYYRNTLSDADMRAAGFDAAVDFQPNPIDYPPPLSWTLPTMSAGRILNRLGRAAGVRSTSRWPVANVYKYREVMNRVMAKSCSDLTTFPCVFPSWDNTPRRRVGATVIQNDDPDLYRTWLCHAIQRVVAYRPSEQIVFINAWNEWAEGCHLEPDQRFGTAFLDATRLALNDTITPS